MKIKILYSPGYGGGWSTWESNPQVKSLMLTWEPLINALERNENISKNHPAIELLIQECKKRKLEPPYIGNSALRDLKICEIDLKNSFFLDEFDGNETVEIIKHDNNSWSASYLFNNKKNMNNEKNIHRDW